MKILPNCSLIAPTYNWTDALELLLISVLRQTVLPNEVIIADDGSRDETKKMIEKFQEKFPIPLVHVWHEDNKNQKPKIMNKAIAASKNEYIIEIDGDIIMNRNFIEDHLKFAEKGMYLFGSRVNIQEKKLSKIFRNKKVSFNFFSIGIKKRFRTLHLPLLMKFAKIVDRRSSKLRGCNMSFWKEDFIKVNGFNEDLQGWGLDDSELIERFHNINLRGKRLKFAGIAYHIYHKEQDKSLTDINGAIERKTVDERLKFITNGVNQYL